MTDNDKLREMQEEARRLRAEERQESEDALQEVVFETEASDANFRFAIGRARTHFAFPIELMDDGQPSGLHVLLIPAGYDEADKRSLTSYLEGALEADGFLRGYCEGVLAERKRMTEPVAITSSAPLAEPLAQAMAAVGMINKALGLEERP